MGIRTNSSKKCLAELRLELNPIPRILARSRIPTDLMCAKAAAPNARSPTMPFSTASERSTASQSSCSDLSCSLVQPRACKASQVTEMPNPAIVTRIMWQTRAGSSRKNCASCESAWRFACARSSSCACSAATASPASDCAAFLIAIKGGLPGAASQLVGSLKYQRGGICTASRMPFSVSARSAKNAANSSQLARLVSEVRVLNSGCGRDQQTCARPAATNRIVSNAAFCQAGVPSPFTPACNWSKLALGSGARGKPSSAAESFSPWARNSALYFASALRSREPCMEIHAAPITKTRSAAISEKRTTRLMAAEFGVSWSSRKENLTMTIVSNFPHPRFTASTF